MLRWTILLSCLRKVKIGNKAKAFGNKLWGSIKIFGENTKIRLIM